MISAQPSRQAGSDIGWETRDHGRTATQAAARDTFNVQRHLTSARTHRAFRASACGVSPTCQEICYVLYLAT